MEKAGFKRKLQAIETAAYKLLNYILSAAAGFIISRAGVKNIFSPFSLSFLSVAPGSGMSVISLFSGTVAGFATKAFSVHNFKYICADTIMLAMILICGKKRYLSHVYTPVLPAVICFISGFIFLFADEFSLYGILLLLCESLICGCSAYFGNYFIKAARKKSQMDSRDIISLNITLLILICALDNFYVYGFSVSLIFVVLLIFMCAYFLDRKLAAVFTLSLCFVISLLHPANEKYILILYIPALICILVSKFDKKYIEASYCLPFFTLSTAIYGVFGFNLQLLLAPLIAAFIFRLFPKAKLERVLSNYFEISTEFDDASDTTKDELCTKFKTSTNNLVREINDTNISPLVSGESEGKMKRYLYLNKCRDITFVNYFSAEGKQITALYCKCDHKPNFQAIRKKLSESVGKNFVINSENYDGRICSLKFEQADNFKVECFALYKPKRGENVCGDNVCAFKSVNSVYNIILADGMGSGKDAYIKSNNTITLLKKLLKSGVSPDKAIESVNASMEMLKEEIGFSTIDLCSISLESGVAKFYKCGAYGGYILRNKKLIKINGGGYPAGLTEKITFSYSGASLEDGDFIVIMSDGVAGACEQIQAALLMSKHDEPEALTRELIDCAYNNIPPEHDDDMTVLTAKVTKRRFE